MTAASRPLPVAVTNARHAREQEGFARTLGPEDTGRYQALLCGTAFQGTRWMRTSDTRGEYALPASRDRRHIEWETSPAESAETTVFTWMGGSRVWPAMLPAYPYLTASLSVDGRHALRFPLGHPDGFRIEHGDVSLEFEPRQFHSLAEPAYHRFFDPAGICGFFRLRVGGARLEAGRPVRLRVDIDPGRENVQRSFHVVPRTDCLQVDLRRLRDEIAVLQRELVTFKRAHEMLTAQVYPELFPERVRGERILVTQDPIRHLHPANVTVMGDGEVVVTMREGVDHLDRFGRMMLTRSRDGGRTWGPREVMFDLGHCDHRSSPIVELPNGDWLTTDYRAGLPGGVYDDQDIVISKLTGASLWGAWSTDRGRTWSFTQEPLTVPGSASAFCETERHMIRLPGGRLLVAAGCCASRGDTIFDGVALFASDDDGRSWSFLSRLPGDTRIEPEPTLLRTRSGKIIMLLRTLHGTHVSHGGDRHQEDWTRSGCLLQTESLDDGRTWSPWRETGMSSMHAPGHLLQLQDGRILVSHASRSYPGSIYLTVSRDEGVTWDTAGTRLVANDFDNFDNSYPTTGQLADGTLITVWYGNLLGRFFIRALRHRPEDL